jgi:hypothetical protein
MGPSSPSCSENFKQPIVFTAYNRPGYLRETLKSWSRVRGIGNTQLDFHVEPNCLETERVIASEATFTFVTTHVNDKHLGTQANPFYAIGCAFASFITPSPRDFVILAEDDFIVSDDALEYLAWARDELYADNRVVTVSCAQHEAQPGGLARVLLIKSWTGWVWGTWRDRWENLLAPGWSFNFDYGGWDWKLIRYWCGERGLLTAAPALSRSQHIGRSGTFTTPETFDDHTSRCFTPEVPPQAYRYDAEPVSVAYHHTGT